MKKILSLIIVITLLAFSTTAQNPIKEYSYYSVSYYKPLILDSTNNQGKKFSFDNFLHTPKIKEKQNLIKIETDNEGIISLKTKNANKENYEIINLFFNITLQKHEKIKFDIISNTKLKVSIDKEKVSEKKTEEKDFSDENKITIEKELEPGNHIIGIASLVSCEDNSKKLKTILYNQDKSSYSIENNSGLTLKTMLCGENPYHISISETGDMYMIKYYNTDINGKNTYRTEVRSTKNDNIIFKDDKIYSYSWMPKSSLLYYTDKSQIYTLNPQTNERKLIIDKMEKEGTITFFQDEKNYLLSYVSKKDNTKGDLHRMYLPDDRIPGWRDRTELFLGTKEYLQPLFHTYHSTYLNDINKENNKILFSITKDNITKRPFTFTSIYQYDLTTQKLDTLVQDDGFIHSAQYLQDKENIVIIASNEAFNSIGSTVKKNQIPNAFNYSIYIMNTKTKEINPIGKTFNPSIKNVIVRKNNLYLVCNDKDSINVYRYNIKNETYTLLPLNVDIVLGFDISNDESQMVYYGENYNKPKRIFRYADNKVKEVYFPKEKEFKQMAIGTMENYSFKIHNSTIDGRLYYPKDFDTTKKYPMVVYYYGGCEPTERYFEMRYSAWLYTQQGYIVYVINPSGTIGWGQEFAARHVNAWGDYTADEIIEGVKRVCRDKKFIDSKHIGCMGASYGGFMTQYLQTKTNIFAAAISHAGISNIASYWGEGYWGYSYSGAATADNYPWNNPNLYTKHSPLFNANKIKTPILLLHGTSDTNVPIGESIQMYNALKILGKEVEFITVKGENHGIVDFNKRMQWNNTIYAWFAKWLKGDESWWNSLYPKEDL